MADTTLFDKAVIFATNAHSGVLRRSKDFPYLIHPLEAAVITSELTSDPEILAAAVLHDVLEDTSTTKADLEQEFTERVADLVASVTNPDIPKTENATPSEMWQQKKIAYIEGLRSASIDTKYLTIGDKLSNMRAITRDYKSLGESLWATFKAGKRESVGWYYTALVEVLKDLEGTAPYEEFKSLVTEMFL